MWSFLPIHTEMACGWKIAGEQRLRRLKISEKDLETNDNRITIFDPSKTILMTDSDVLHSECNHLKMEIKQMEREHATEIKTLEKPLHQKVEECVSVSISGAKMKGAQDMQGHVIFNLT